MVSESEGMQIVADTLSRDSRLPEKMSYIVHEVDPEGEQASVPLPVTEIQNIQSSREDLSNSTHWGYVEDSNGNRVGEIYESKWRVELQIDVWTADGSNHDSDDLAETARTVLFDHDSKGPNEPFRYDDGEAVSLLWNFELGPLTRSDDLAQTPSVRRSRLRSTLYGAERYRQTGKDTIRSHDDTITVKQP